MFHGITNKVTLESCLIDICILTFNLLGLFLYAKDFILIDVEMLGQLDCLKYIPMIA